MTPDEVRRVQDVPSPVLVELIHRQRGILSTRQQVQGAQSLLAGLEWGRRRRRSRGRLMLVAALAMVAVVVAGALIGERRTGTLSYAIDGGRVERAGFIQAEAVAQPTLHFSDGSEVSLHAGTKAWLRSVDRYGARVALAEGGAHVDIVHAPGTRWRFDAGPFAISVTGTAFTFGWRSADGQLDVTMERGTVEVSGPVSDGVIVLRSGQHLIVRVPEGETLIREASTEARGQEAIATQALDRSPEPPPSGAEAMRAPGRASGRPSVLAATRTWAAEVAHGDFDAVVKQAEQMGIDACLAGAGSGDLAALADAARYGRRDELARRALLAQRRRFPLSVPARDASFLLGRLDESEQNVASAIDAYDGYLAQSPDGTYASEALGRKMILVQRLYGDPRARSVAEEYVARFPKGTYAARARALIQTL